MPKKKLSSLESSLDVRTRAPRASPPGELNEEARHGFLSRNDWAANHFHSKSLRCRVLAAEASAVWRIQASRHLMHSGRGQLPPLPASSLQVRRVMCVLQSEED